MAEIGLIASVIQVAGAGLKLSQTLYQYADGVATADRRIKDIAKEIQLTSFVVEELGTVFKQDETSTLMSENAVKTAHATMKECSTVFAEIDATLKKSKKNTLGRLMLPFRDNKIELLRNHIDKLKSTLQLLMQVLTHAHQVASKKLDREAEVKQKAQIQELIELKKKSAKKYEESLKNFSISDGSTVIDDDEPAVDEDRELNFPATTMAVTAAAIGSSITAKTLETCVLHVRNLLEDIENLQQALSVQADDHSEHHQSLIGSYFRARGHLDKVLFSGSQEAGTENWPLQTSDLELQSTEKQVAISLKNTSVVQSSIYNDNGSLVSVKETPEHAAAELARKEEMAKMKLEIEQLRAEKERAQSEAQRERRRELERDLERERERERLAAEHSEKRRSEIEHTRKIPIKLEVGTGGTMTIPFRIAKTWQGLKTRLESRYARARMDKWSRLAAKGHFDILDSKGHMILPEDFEDIVEPGMAFSMQFWSEATPGSDTDDSWKYSGHGQSRLRRHSNAVAQDSRSGYEDRAEDYPMPARHRTRPQIHAPAPNVTIYNTSRLDNEGSPNARAEDWIPSSSRSGRTRRIPVSPFDEWSLEHKIAKLELEVDRGSRSRSRHDGPYRDYSGSFVGSPSSSLAPPSPPPPPLHVNLQGRDRLFIESDGRDIRGKKEYAFVRRRSRRSESSDESDGTKDDAADIEWSHLVSKNSSSQEDVAPIASQGTSRIESTSLPKRRGHRPNSPGSHTIGKTSGDDQSEAQRQREQSEALLYRRNVTDNLEKAKKKAQEDALERAMRKRLGRFGFEDSLISAPISTEKTNNSASLPRPLLQAPAMPAIGTEPPEPFSLSPVQSEAINGGDGISITFPSDGTDNDYFSDGKIELDPASIPLPVSPSPTPSQSGLVAAKGVLAARGLFKKRSNVVAKPPKSSDTESDGDKISIHSLSSSAPIRAPYLANTDLFENEYGGREGVARRKLELTRTKDRVDITADSHGGGRHRQYEPKSPSKTRKSASGGGSGERQHSNESSPRQKPSRTASVSSKRPPGTRRLTQETEGCRDPNWLTIGPNAVPPRRLRPEMPPSMSSHNVRNLEIPSDQVSHRSDPNPYSPPSPTYTRQPAPYGGQGPAVVQPAHMHPHRPSNAARPRPQSFAAESGTPYWIPGITPSGYPGLPQIQESPAFYEYNHNQHMQYEPQRPPLRPYEDEEDSEEEASEYQYSSEEGHRARADRAMMPPPKLHADRTGSNKDLPDVEHSGKLGPETERSSRQHRDRNKLKREQEQLPRERERRPRGPEEQSRTSMIRSDYEPHISERPSLGKGLQGRGGYNFAQNEDAFTGHAGFRRSGYNQNMPTSIKSSRRSSISSVPDRGYILDLAAPTRIAPDDGSGSNRKRTQKHPATFQCTLCPKRFTRTYNLRSHLRTHTDERPFLCSVCGEAFARQHDRKRHEGLHSGESGRRMADMNLIGDSSGHTNDETDQGNEGRLRREIEQQKALVVQLREAEMRAKEKIELDHSKQSKRLDQSAKRSETAEDEQWNRWAHWEVRNEREQKERTSVPETVSSQNNGWSTLKTSHGFGSLSAFDLAPSKELHNRLDPASSTALPSSRYAQSGHSSRNEGYGRKPPVIHNGSGQTSDPSASSNAPYASYYLDELPLAEATENERTALEKNDNEAKNSRSPTGSEQRRVDDIDAQDVEFDEGSRKIPYPTTRPLGFQDSSENGVADDKTARRDTSKIATGVAHTENTEHSLNEVDELLKEWTTVF